MTGTVVLGTLTWHPRLSPVLCGLVVALLAAWIYALYNRMLTRLSKQRAKLLILPKM